MTPVETRVAKALAADVARFDPLLTPHEIQLTDLQHADQDLMPVHSGHRPPRRRTITTALAAAALVFVAVAAIAVRRDDDTSGSDSAIAVRRDDDTSGSDSVPSSTERIPVATGPIVAPPGVEQPLVETVASDIQQVGKPGSVHAFSVQGHPDVLLWTTLSLNVTGQVEEYECVSEAGGSGCGPTSVPAQSGQTSSVDNQVAGDDLFTWSNLPPDVRSVSYDDGAVQSWQRPVAGLAIFRVDPQHPHPTITAHDATGAALPYSFWGTNLPLTPTPTSTVVAAATQELPGEIFGELEGLIQSSLHDCLASHGATWSPANVPSFAADAESLEIWKLCTAEVSAIVAHRKAELSDGG